VIHGSDLRPLNGQGEERLEVLAYREGRLTPIPFQLDQIRSNGEFALPAGAMPVAGDHAGTLGPLDELVIMGRDCGGRVTDSSVLPDNALEIEVAGSFGGSDYYAYIAAVISPRRSPVRYVNYQPALHVVKTDDYLLTMENELPASFSLEQGSRSNQLAHGFEARAEARLLKLFPVHFSEREVRSSIVAYKVGPVRVIRKIRHWLSLAHGIESPSVTRCDLFYRDSIDEPLTVELPWVPGFLFGNISVRFDIVLRGTAGLTLSWSDSRGPAISLNDKDVSLRIQEHPKAHWLMLHTRDRALVGSFMPTSAINTLTVQLYYRNRSTANDSSAADILPRLGFLLTDWQRLTRGSHRVEFILANVPRDYSGGALAQELSTGPTVRVYRRARPS
jgi:hypothetical protein